MGMTGDMKRTVRVLTRAAVREPQTRPDLRRWLDSVWRRRDPLVSDMPGLTFGAIDWLEKTLTPAMHVFEYGSGASTLFFAARAGRVVSVEHHPAWRRRVDEALDRRGLENCERILVEPEPAPEPSPGDGPYRSRSTKHAGQSFEKYVRMIDPFPEGHFDMVLVDGRARNDCVRHALPRIRPGGRLILDNSERPYYEPAMELMRGHEATHFEGLGPRSARPWRTTVWRINAPDESSGVNPADL